MQSTAASLTVEDPAESAPPMCVMVFNANDPSGAAGLAADLATIASVGVHGLPVLTGAYARDTGEVFSHFSFDDEAVTEQARAALEDIPVQVFKVGFVGSPENVGAIAAIVADYPDTPLVAYMPDLSWWDEVEIDLYLDAFQEMLLPQTTVLVGNHSTLWRWLLPDWSTERSPGPREIARAARELGVPYTLVTGISMPEQFIDNVLASPQAVLAHEQFERIEALFSGAGDTLSAALCALLANGSDLSEAFTESLSYLDRCLEAGFRPGMGHIVPDRLFWAQPEIEPQDASEQNPFPPSISNLESLPNDTKH